MTECRYPLKNQLHGKPDRRANQRADDAVTPPQQRAGDGAEHAEQQDDFNQTDGIVEHADV